MFKKNQTILLLFSLLLIMQPHISSAATNRTIQNVQQQITQFNSSPDYLLAPATATKAQAYLGAAMMAEDDGREADMTKGINRALEKLNEAEETARQFRQKFTAVLNIKQQVAFIFSQIQFKKPSEESDARRLLQESDKLLSTTIKQFERGQLSASQQSAGEAEASYRKTVVALLPELADKTAFTLLKAIEVKARTYTPKTYAQANVELNKIQDFIDDPTQSSIDNPIYALSLAELSLELAREIKTWHETKGGDEAYLLNARSERLKLARDLGMEVDLGSVGSDVSMQGLGDAVTALKKELAAEKKARLADQAAAKTARTKQLEEQKSLLLSQQNSQLRQVQEAFRAKLERETFEIKRQKKLRALFKKGEVEILVNVNGSLLIRLNTLKFAMGSSKVAKNYHALLTKVKQMLDIYGERNVRIEGHTDDTGDVKLNHKISLQRAESVRNFLVSKGVDASRLKALGYGEVRPIASNEFKKGREMNRRIDLVIEAMHD